jgi:hypothetical protein
MCGILRILFSKGGNLRKKVTPKLAILLWKLIKFISKAKHQIIISTVSKGSRHNIRILVKEANLNLDDDYIFNFDKSKNTSIFISF